MFQTDAIVEAFHIFFTLQVFLWISIGVFLGGVIGAIPGLSATSGIALVLPVAFVLPVAPALGLTMGLYKGALFGGSITAISFGIPGTPDAAPTVYDGYKLMQKGEGRKAVEMALAAGVTGDSLSDVFTIIVAPLVAIVALAFGPTERLWLIVLAICVIGALTGRHLVKGLISAAIGIFIGTIGSDPIGMVSRMTFGQWWLMDGIPLIPLFIGIFALPPVLDELSKLLEKRGKGDEVAVEDYWKIGPGLTFKEYWRCRKEMGMGTAVGTFIGMLPGLGSTIGAFVSYGIARQISPEKGIGTGKLEGLAAVESGSNSTCGPTLIPLLAFGIPGSAAAALIGANLMLHGATPSPRMFELYPHIVYALFMIILVANVFNLTINRFVARLFVMVGQLPKSYLFPLILLMAVVGAYAYRQNPYDIIILVGCGLLGFGMKIVKIPVAPLVIAFLLTPMAEANLRRALLIAGGNWGQALFGTPLALGLIVTVVVLMYFIVRFLLKKVEMD
ncbi:MAG: tripartite tricarboxylate transporter permease [Thermodesulfobacteriota bacterium]|nr:tripartite tricarboxylate transporter permease [Thermodesulfobacteriota bacterium]